MYESNEAAVKSEVKTFFEAFPHGAVFANTIQGTGYDMVPPLWDPAVCDGYVGISDEEASETARLLAPFARAESGQISISREKVVVHDVVHEAIEEHRAAAEAAGLTLAYDADGADVLVNTDPARITQVLGNLVSNAIKYTPPGGHIAVSTEMSRRLLCATT